MRRAKLLIDPDHRDQGYIEYADGEKIPILSRHFCKIYVRELVNDGKIPAEDGRDILRKLEVSEIPEMSTESTVRRMLALVEKKFGEHMSAPRRVVNPLGVPVEKSTMLC
jgi:hypothetical protein